MTAYKDGEESVYPIEIDVPSSLFRRLESQADACGQDVDEYCFWILYNYEDAPEPGQES